MTPQVEATLDGEVETRVVVAIGHVVRLEARRPPGEVEQRTTRVLVEAMLLSQAEDSFELTDEIGGLGGQIFDDRQVDLRVDLGFDMTELLRNRQCAVGP